MQEALKKQAESPAAEAAVILPYEVTKEYYIEQLPPLKKVRRLV